MTPPPDPHHLQRFITAQDRVYQQVCAELAAGAKTSHWMWFVFPQLQALGRSAMARHYGLASLAEAQAYWQHPVLCDRLKECTGLMLAVRGKTALQILRTPDDMKFQSCMTLFSRVAQGEPMFNLALDKCYGGVPDARTSELLVGC